MNVNLNNAIYAKQGIDINNVDKASAQILKSAADNQPKVQSIDYSKFNRATLGIDLYSSRTNVELQKQIALTQAGLYAQAINVAKLNSSAAANLYSANTVQRNVELTQSTIANNELAPVKKLEQNSNTIELLNVADKNSNSSNGFNPFKSSNEKSAKGEKEAELNNLFA